MKSKILWFAVFLIALYFLGITYQKLTSHKLMLNDIINVSEYDQKYSKIIFAGGCFWCTEAEFNHSNGVIAAISGYADTNKESPTYEEISNQMAKDGSIVTGREAVLIYYDKNKIALDQLLEKYWKHIDPTDSGGAFADRGHQYTTAIYYYNEEDKATILASRNKVQKYIDQSANFSMNETYNTNTIEKENLKPEPISKKIVTEILPYNNFYPAEEYHQDYKDKNPVRYEYYRNGSGRNTFIKIHWPNGDIYNTSVASSALLGHSTSSTIAKANADFWKSFTPEDKAKRIKELTSLQHKVTQESGTEPPMNNLYDKNYEPGIYVDIVSGEPLYLSTDKFDSGTGWPSFVKPVSTSSVTLHVDKGLFTTRTEVRSAIADSHIGHVFEDGPVDRGGKRYCMNSAAMNFIPLADMEAKGYGEYIKLIK